ncbi:MAG: zf-TFIIB domain-containing protein [Nocardioides sp.]
MDSSDEMTCPKCQSALASRHVGDVTVHQCASCSGIFLERAELWNLIDAENDWHIGRESGPVTQPLPRITADMTAPPPSSTKAARAYIEALFS